MEPGARVWDDDASPAEEERYREIIRERVENSPFYQHMGLEVTGLGHRWAMFKMPAGRHLWNAGGIAHGGAITSKKGSRIAVCEVEVTDGDRLVAKGMSTYMIMRAGDWPGRHLPLESPRSPTPGNA